MSVLCGTLFANSNLTIAMEALERGDFKTAVVCFTSLAQEGDFIGQQNLGVMYNNGFGVAENKEIASYWFNKAQATMKQNSDAKKFTSNQEGCLPQVVEMENSDILYKEFVTSGCTPCQSAL